MKRIVTYSITEDSYWKVGQHANRVKMGKAEFIDLLISLFADKVELDINKYFKMNKDEKG